MARGVNTRMLAWVVDALAGARETPLVEDGLGGRENARWSGAVIDSRADCSGRLFFALRGEKTDGHRYVFDAFAAGCSAVVVEDSAMRGELESRGVPYLLVSDTASALRELARAYRRELDVRVVAITGSAGKTTTKEFVRQILRSKYRVYANPGNYNSTIGVPVTILETEPDTEYLVCEIGANHPGEIHFLSGLLRPQFGVITNIGDAHIGLFGSVENIARAKGELLDVLDPSGYALLPADDAFIEDLKRRSRSKTATFGCDALADFRLGAVEQRDGSLVFEVNDCQYMIQSLGEYNALNACAAVAVGELCGVEVALIRGALEQVPPTPGRGKTHRVAGITVVDESYNANPASMRRSLAMLSGLAAGRRLAVLGDMKELGDYSSDLHRALGEALAGTRVDAVFWLGEEGGTVREGFTKSGGRVPFRLHHDLDSLLSDVRGWVREGDALLVKASHACNLDAFVDRLLRALEAAGGD